MMDRMPFELKKSSLKRKATASKKSVKISKQKRVLGDSTKILDMLEEKEKFLNDDDEGGQIIVYNNSELCFKTFYIHF